MASTSLAVSSPHTLTVQSAEGGETVQVVVLDCPAFVPVSMVACTSLAVSSPHTLTVQSAEGGETVQDVDLDRPAFVPVSVVACTSLALAVISTHPHSSRSKCKGWGDSASCSS